MMIRGYFTLLLMLACSFTTYGQEILTTKSGQKILLNSDGSWGMTARDAILDGDGNISIAKATGVEVFELPQAPSTLTKSQEREKAALLQQLQEREATYTVVMHYSKQNIEQLESLANQPDAETVTAELAAAKKEYKLTKTQSAKTSNYIAELNKLPAMSQSKISKKLSKIAAEVQEEYDLQTTGAGVVASQERSIEAKQYATTFDMAADLTDKTRYPCEITFDGKDPVTRKKKKETGTGRLFTYTQPKLKPYFKSDDFMKCDSRLTKVGKNYYLTLEFRLRSKDATKNYGKLNTDGEVRIEFIDGTFILGKNIVADSGEIEPYSGNTLYTAIYLISKASINDLEKKLVDNVGVMWSSGFEQYDIYNVDYLQHQVKCLKND